MKRIQLAIVLVLVFVLETLPTHAQPTRVNSSGVVLYPTNFWSANASNYITELMTRGVKTNAASATANGWLSSNDWQAFNAKQTALGYTPPTNTPPGIILALGYTPQTALGYTPATNSFSGISTAQGYVSMPASLTLSNLVATGAMTNGLIPGAGISLVTNAGVITVQMNFSAVTNSLAGVLAALGYTPMTNSAAAIATAQGYTSMPASLALSNMVATGVFTNGLLAGSGVTFTTNGGVITITAQAGAGGAADSINPNAQLNGDQAVAVGANYWMVSTASSNGNVQLLPPTRMYFDATAGGGLKLGGSFGVFAPTGSITGTLKVGGISGSAVLPEVGLSMSDNTTANASTVKHGFMPKLSGSGTDVLGGDGSWIGQAQLSVDNAARLGGMPFTQFRTNETTYYNLRWYAPGGAIELTNATIAAGSMLVTNPGAAFTSNDVGKWFMIANANGLGTNLLSLITNVVSSTSLQLSNAATVGATNWQARYGLDSAYGWNVMMTNIYTQATNTGGNFEVFIPDDKYMVANPFFQSAGSNWMQLWLPVVGLSDSKWSIWIHGSGKPNWGGGVFNGGVKLSDDGAIFLFARSPNQLPLDQVVTNSCGIGYVNSVEGSGAFGNNHLGVTLENIIFRTWENQTLSPVGFDRMALSRIHYCNADDGWYSGRLTSNPAFPTYGFRAPNGQNYPGMDILNCDAVGYGSGILGESDLVIDKCRVLRCNSILTIGPNATGALKIPYMWASYCPTGIVNFANFGGWPGADITLSWEVSHSNALGNLPWMQYSCTYYNPNNTAVGEFKYNLSANYGYWTNSGLGTTAIPDLFVGATSQSFHPRRLGSAAEYRNGLNVGATLNADALKVTNTATIQLTMTSNLMVNPAGAAIRIGPVDIGGYSGISFDAVGSYGANNLTRANSGIWGGTAATILQGPVVGFNSGSNVRGYIGTAGGWTIGTSSSDTLPAGSLMIDGWAKITGTPTLVSTGAAPANVTVGTTAPDGWFMFTNAAGVRVKVPAWTEH